MRAGLLDSWDRGGGFKALRGGGVEGGTALPSGAIPEELQGV